MLSCNAVNFTEVNQRQYMFESVFDIKRAVFEPQERLGTREYISFCI